MCFFDNLVKTTLWESTFYFFPRVSSINSFFLAIIRFCAIRVVMVTQLAAGTPGTPDKQIGKV